MKEHCQNVHVRKDGCVSRENYSRAFMSDTKWRLLIQTLAQHGVTQTIVIVKFIDVDQPKEISFPPSLYCPTSWMDTFQFGPVELCSIEWMKFDCDVSEPLIKTGKKFPIEVIDGETIVTGYLR
ncbi:DUF6678 family protein [Roseibium sp.]|uniref:DUF6678 family protein n=1 Tax=Roseibium sp. TaxID=1936156 RepID=UPI003B52BCBF